MGYDKTIATGSMSKAYSLAGIRVGWIASRNTDIVKKIHQARHYTTISVSQLDCNVAAFALSPSTIHALTSRNIKLAKTNVEILEKFIGEHKDKCDCKMGSLWTQLISANDLWMMLECFSFQVAIHLAKNIEGTCE
jgi:aspartate/methionine/tyrosine aminotransferase